MKRAVGLILLLVLLLTGCVAVPVEPPAPPEPYTQYAGNTQFLIDPGSQTITANGYEFTYSYFENDNTRGVRVTYPNGAVITKSTTYDSNGVGMGGTSWDNADANFIISNGVQYADGYDLLDVVPAQVVQEKKGEFIPLIFVGIAIIALGVWMYAQPYNHWYWSHGWMYNDAEPSDTALGVIGAMGIIEIIVGVILILIGIFA